MISRFTSHRFPRASGPKPNTGRAPTFRYLGMAWILFIFTTLLSFLSFAQMPMPLDTCNDDSERLVKMYSKRIAIEYETRNLTNAYQRFEEYVRRCNVNLRRYGIDGEFLKGLTKRSQELELERKSKAIEHYAKFGKTDKISEDYRELAKSMGFSDKQIENYLSKYQKVAEESYERERKSCKPVDMSPEFGPNRDQDSLGWCHAFTAADIFSYKLKQRISASDIALTYNSGALNDYQRIYGKSESAFDGGMLEPAMNKSLEKGLCLEKDFPSEDNINSQFKTNLDLIDRLRRGEAPAMALECQEVRTAAKKLFPNLNISDIRKISLATTTKDMVRRMNNATCKNRIKAPIAIVSQVSYDKDQLFKTIDENLDQRNPLGMAYNADVLYNKATASSEANHASIIAGRNFNEKTGQCEYLVRNSWGAGCAQYDPTLKCKQGNIWVPKADLTKSLAQVIYAK